MMAVPFHYGYIFHSLAFPSTSCYAHLGDFVWSTDFVLCHFAFQFPAWPSEKDQPFYLWGCHLWGHVGQHLLIPLYTYHWLKANVISRTYCLYGLPASSLRTPLNSPHTLHWTCLIAPYCSIFLGLESPLPCLLC